MWTATLRPKRINPHPKKHSERGRCQSCGGPSPTGARHRRFFSQPSSGFTLIEMLLVLGIIAGVLIATGQRVFKGQESAATVIRKFSVLTRQLHTQAKLQGVVFRLVLSKEKQENGRIAHAFWVERASGSDPILIRPVDPEEAYKELQEQQEAAKDKKDKKDEDKKPSPFAMDTQILKEPKVLPPNLEFKQIETEGYTEPVEEGRAYIHFFPQGFIEESVIQLTNPKGSLEWTLLIHPLTGKTDLLKEHIDLKDLQEDR